MAVDRADQLVSDSQRESPRATRLAGPIHLGCSVTSLTQASAAGSTNVERRLAIRIRLRVGGEFKPGLSVKDVHVDYSSMLNPFGKGDATITYTIHNTGNAIVAARQAAAISGPFGRLRVRSDEVDDSPQLLPGDTWTVSVPIHEVAATVPLTVTVTLVPCSLTLRAR